MEPIFKELSPARKLWSLLFIFLIGYTTFAIVAGILIQYSFNIQTEEQFMSMIANGDVSAVMAMKVMQLIGSVGSFIVPAHLFSLLAAGNYKTYYGFDKSSQIKIFVFTALAIICAQPFINAMAALNEQMIFPGFMSGLENWIRESEEFGKKVTKLFLQMDGFSDLLLNIFIVAFIPALGEEMFFRGAMQKTFIEWTGSIHKSIWITAAIFSFIHFQFYGFLPRMVMGAMLGYMMVWGGTLWLPVAAHFTNNALGVLLNYWVQKNYLSEDAEILGSTMEEIIYTIGSILLTSAFLFFIYKNKKNEHESYKGMPPPPLA